MLGFAKMSTFTYTNIFNVWSWCRSKAYQIKKYDHSTILKINSLYMY